MTGGTPEALLARLDNLADPTRLRLLNLLDGRELGVAELCDALQLPQSTASRHLKVLADQGWVRSRAHRTANLYRMAGDDLDPTARRLWQLARDESADWGVLRQDLDRLELRLEQRGAEEFFAAAAADWDRMRSEVYGAAFTQHALLALLPDDWVVADLGCGTGASVAELAPRVRRVVGVDRSEQMLEAARRRTAGFENVELHRAELAQLPLREASCDAAQMLLVLTYVREPAAVLASLARVLRPGGRAVVVDLLRHDDDEFRRRMGQRSLGFESEELAGLMRRAGLSRVAVRSLGPESGSRGPALLLGTGVRGAGRNGAVPAAGGTPRNGNETSRKRRKGVEKR
jgi:ArsR family transcriptional regulator